MADLQKIFPRTGDTQTVYLKNVVTNPNIEIGGYTMYNDFVSDPAEFERNNVLYHYPINHDKLKIGKFCSIACGAKFLFNSANHTMASLSTYPFPLFFEEWGLEKKSVTKAYIFQFCLCGKLFMPMFMTLLVLLFSIPLVNLKLNLLLPVVMRNILLRAVFCFSICFLVFYVCYFLWYIP